MVLFFTICKFVSCLMVDLEFAKLSQVVSSLFVGVTIDSSVIRNRWMTMDFSSQKMLTLARGLAPSYIRVGGTDCDFLIFNMTEDRTLRYKPQAQYVVEDELDKTGINFTMTPEDWDKLNLFTQDVGWSLIFDFNVFLRKNGQWDPTNAKELLRYTVLKGYKPAGYELGNEPNSFYHNFHFRIPGDLMATYFKTLQSMLDSFPQLGTPIIIGPDTTQVQRKSAREYLTLFLSAGGGKSVDVATFHHYYLDSKTATVEQFHDPTILDSLTPEIITAVNIVRQNAPGKQCWLGETSSAYGGGALGISDRYVAGFLWLDKLGLSALHGLQGVLRQTFYGNRYGLIDVDLNPNPDYWLTLLYKRLVGGRVLSLGQESNPNLRVYAHCANNNSSMGYSKGDITVYVINLSNDVITVNITGIPVSTRHLYILSPGDDSGLTSRYVKLNGEVLMLPNDEELPTLKPKIQEGNVLLQGYNMGFIVIPGARKHDCL
ncbi:heparanase isoform X2 [Patella vulgata]|uniref:heparanase isoform X2 n=1 Tax=Patella vulgata TaxID=6465 RepID=UPI0024A9A76F|nr:heparanase isoform X2 [Patella vulgata]